jgi:hypothetical protein
MANQFSKGHVFVPGEVVDPDDLNNLVDLATALGPLVSSQPAVTADVADSIIISDASDSGNLKKALISTLPGAGTVTSVGLIANPTSVFGVTGSPVTASGSITLSLDIQTAHKVLAGPTSGSSAPAFRTLLPADLTTGTQTIAINTIDWSLGNTFFQNPGVGVPRTFSFTNVAPGQTIKVILFQPGGATAAWSYGTLLWKGGAAPALTTTINHTDVYTFTAEGVTVLGHSDKDYF